MHAVTEQLHAVYLHVSKVLRGIRSFQRLEVDRFVPLRGLGPYAAPQVEVNGLKKALPPVAQSQGPVEAIQRNVQLGFFPVRVAILIDGHGPAFRMASAERVDVDRQRRLQGGVLGHADLQRDAQEHMDAAGFELVALQCKQHPLSPRRVEPDVEANVVADKDGVRRDAAVPVLQ